MIHRKELRWHYYIQNSIISAKIWDHGERRIIGRCRRSCIGHNSRRGLQSKALPSDPAGSASYRIGQDEYPANRSGTVEQAHVETRHLDNEDLEGGDNHQSRGQSQICRCEAFAKF